MDSLRRQPYGLYAAALRRPAPEPDDPPEYPGDDEEAPPKEERR